MISFAPPTPLKTASSPPVPMSPLLPRPQRSLMRLPRQHDLLPQDIECRKNHIVLVRNLARRRLLLDQANGLLKIVGPRSFSSSERNAPRSEGLSSPARASESLLATAQRSQKER